ncbi:MAG: hypothetical protein NT023_05695 [Armatimonadetes bacterium]|nr:hypothetical protein [Armatimonadota bacterium]
MSEKLEQALAEMIDALENGSRAEQFSAGYRLAAVANIDSSSPRLLRDLVDYYAIDYRDKIEDCLPVRFFYTPNELAFDIRTECFPQSEPVIGAAQDSRAGFRPYIGLTSAGTAQLPEESELFCMDDDVGILYLFKCDEMKSDDVYPVLVSEAIGEFYVEVYHMVPDNSMVRIFREGFCLK